MPGSSATSPTTDIAPALVGSIEAVIGVLTVLAAPRLARSPWAGLSSTAMRRVVRILGTRQVVQGLVTIGSPSRRVLAGGAAVDALHALSLVPVMVVDGPYRRQSAGSALLAVAGSIGAVAAARRARA